MAASTAFNWQTQHCKIHGNFESDPQGNRRTGPLSWENISNAETRVTLHHPVAVSGRLHLPPPPQYVEAPSTRVGRCRFHGLGRGRFFRGDWWNIWGEDHVQPRDTVSVGYGHGVTPRDMVGPATADKNGRVNVKPSRFLMTIASATEKARLRGERVAALRAGRKTVSLADRNTLLGYLRKTLDEATVPAMLKVCSSVEICHPKPQTFLKFGFDHRAAVASSYLTCAGAESVRGWLGNDDVASRRFEAHEARKDSGPLG